ncbi:MAG: glycoside hydrolase N-terminal domain-containing protein [Puniceicoccaceae bacterium]
MSLFICLVAHADMTLWYRQAAKSRSDSLALGNGRIGAVLHHGVEKELIQLSEETLWVNRHVGVEEGCRLREKIPMLWELLDADEFEKANELVEDHAFDARTQLRHEMLANLFLEFTRLGPISDYRRELDMRNGLARLTFSDQQAQFLRESFISAVDDIMVIRLTCNQPGRISFSVRLDRNGAARDPEVIADGNVLRMYGPGGSPESGVMFDLQIEVRAEGGSVLADNDTLSVSGADSVILYVNAETNFEWGELLDDNLEALCASKIESAMGRSYADLRNDHVADHSSYFNRCELYLGESTREQKSLPTDERVDRMRGGPRVERPARNDPIYAVEQTPMTLDPELEAQMFQFGRYLLISSSRPGTQPATLHGIWPNDIGVEGHNMAYHLNINIAENYWPAEVTGIPEMHLPLFDLLEKYIPNASIYAREGYGCGGVVCGHNIDPWFSIGRRGATPAAAQWIGGFGWKAQHVWNHYAYSGDEEFLREQGLPIMLAAAEFFLDYSRQDPVSGKIYIGPSGSPENRFKVPGSGEKRLTVDYGISIDQEIAHELFRNCIQAANTLGIENSSLIERMKHALPLLALPGIDSKGRLMEWREERTELEPRHRHISQAYGLHPGNRFNVDDNPELVKALNKSLRYRFGGEREIDYAVGRLDWQQSWYLSIYARMRDKKQFERVYRDFMRVYMEHNLNSWWTTRPYVMDASGALTAGMAEALLQSHAGEIHLLPCLPDMWPEGSFSGFRGRGGVTIDASWNKEKVVATLRTNKDDVVLLRLGDSIKEVRVKTHKRTIVTFNRSTKEISQ